MQLPIISFIQTRLAEADPNFDVREGTAFYDLFVSPQQFMLQPLNDFMTKRRVGQSVRQMLLDPTPDTPTTFDSSDADDSAGNLYVIRDTGSISTGTVRVYYVTPKALDLPALTAQFTAGTLNFFNLADFNLSASQMALQSDGSLFFADIPIRAEQAGAEYAVVAGSITAFINDSDAVRVTNIAATSSATSAETNTQLLQRTEKSIAVRDLETEKGINAILKSLFPFLREIVSIGMGDPEMQRDIVYNVHVGGRTDVYLKTPSLTAGSKVINGLDVDTTREVNRNLHIMVARDAFDSQFPPFTGTPSIVANSEILKEDIVETAATISSIVIPPTTGVDLTGKEWLNMTLNDGSNLQFKVSGATVSQTQRFEIINTINVVFGITIAFNGPGNTIVLKSNLIGAGSAITFNDIQSPISPSENAAGILFGESGPYPQGVVGVEAAVYVNGVDYIIDYPSGLIYQPSYLVSVRDPGLTGRQTITSGQSMIPLLPASPPTTGQFTIVGPQAYLDDSVSNRFFNPPLVYVRPGDLVTITSIDGNIAGTFHGITVGSQFIVSQVVSNTRIQMSGFNPTSGSSANSIRYTVVSQQVVVASYDFNPISIDIGGQVLLADGLTRGVRPGRADFTITDTPFVKITSIQQVDPDTGEPVGSLLTAPGGFGAGGYGVGGYGVGLSGDYSLVVNSPKDRYSVFEDSMIVFGENGLSNSYIVNYLWDPQLQGIHSITRSDTERVTGADVLVKTFIPCFVDMTVGIRRDATNTATPSNADLAVLVQNMVETTAAATGLKESAIVQLLENEGVSSVQTPFTMTGTIYNPDGSTTIISSQDILTVPEVTLESQTDNFTTARITHFFAETITVVEVT